MQKILLAIGSVFLFVTAAFSQSDSLKEYTGVYKFPEGTVISSVEITLQDGGLVASSTMGTAAFTYVAKDTFSIPQYNGMVYFTRNGNAVNGIRIDVQGMILEGKKETPSFMLNREWLLPQKLSKAVQ